MVYLRILVGGVERVLDGTLPLLASSHQIAVFTEIHERGNFPFLDSLVTFKLGGYDNTLPSSSSTIGRIIERRRLETLAKKVREWKPDAILLCGSKASRYSNWLASEAGVPTVVYFQSLYDIKVIRQPPSRFRNRLTRFYKMHLTAHGCESSSMNNVKLAICVSNVIQNAASNKFPELKTTVVHNGVDHRVFHPTFEDENFALCISRFSPEKNLQMIPNALCSTGYPVILYGTVINDGIRSKTDYLESLKSHKCSNISFEFHKNQNTLVRRLQTCSLFVFPSKNEAFGLSPLEAMACGKVVICHNSGGMPESVGDSGYLLGDDENEWRNTVDELMKTESLRKDLGKKAWEYSKNFTWEKTAIGVEKALEDACAK